MNELKTVCDELIKFVIHWQDISYCQCVTVGVNGPSTTTCIHTFSYRKFPLSDPYI